MIYILTPRKLSISLKPHFSYQFRTEGEIFESAIDIISTIYHFSNPVLYKERSEDISLCNKNIK